MDFIFTFGPAHKTSNGKSLHDKYCVVSAENELEARRVMCMVRGQRWSICYDTKEEAGVDNYKLTPIDLNDIG